MSSVRSRITIDDFPSKSAVLRKSFPFVSVFTLANSTKSAASLKFSSLDVPACATEKYKCSENVERRHVLTLPVIRVYRRIFVSTSDSPRFAPRCKIESRVIDYKGKKISPSPTSPTSLPLRMFGGAQKCRETREIIRIYVLRLLF
ncbi:hypothetical protein P5V15_008446 [Pogonomyrmex californicus]